MARPGGTDGYRRLRLLVGTLFTPQIKDLMVEVIPTELFPSGTKVVLIEKLMQYVERNAPHGYRCVLSKFPKRKIDNLLPRGGKTKAHSMEMFIALDQPGSAATTPSPPSGGKTPSDSALALVPYVAPEGRDLPIVPFSAPRLKKRLIKRWRKLWQRNVLSQKLVKHLRNVMATEGVADLTIKEIHFEVIKRIGVNFDTDRKRNMYVFFYKKLQRMLRKMNSDRKKKSKTKKKKDTSNRGYGRY